MLENLIVCQDNYGVDRDGSPWSNNILAPRAVQGPTGLVGMPGTVDSIEPGPSHARAKQLAGAAAAVAAGMHTGLGSEGSEAWEAYFVSAYDEWRAKAINQPTIRSLFGDALYPATDITIERLSTDGEWWELVEDDAGGDEAHLAQWRRLVGWFDACSDFVETAYVAIDRTDDVDPLGGCVYPRLLIGRLADGSLAGLLGVVVYT